MNETDSIALNVELHDGSTYTISDTELVNAVLHQYGQKLQAFTNKFCSVVEKHFDVETELTVERDVTQWSDQYETQAELAPVILRAYLQAPLSELDTSSRRHKIPHLSITPEKLKAYSDGLFVLTPEDC